MAACHHAGAGAGQSPPSYSLIPGKSHRSWPRRTITCTSFVVSTNYIFAPAPKRPTVKGPQMLAARGAQASSSSAQASCSKRVASRGRLSVARAAASAVGTAADQNGKDPVKLNIIPHSQWENGIPPVMGAHLMASGIVAPVSTSKGAGIDVAPPVFEYPGAANTQVVVYATPKSASAGLAKAVAAAASAAIKAKGTFTLVLSGGSLISSIAGLADTKGIDWSKWHIFFVDERNVPHTSSDSNLKGAQDALLSRVPLPAANVYAMSEGLPVDQAAVNYEGRLVGLPAGVLPRNTEGWPVFDMVLLGVGPDGHVASLFPNKASLGEAKAWVLPVSNSPKPPPERITMTLPVINAAKEVRCRPPGCHLLGLAGAGGRSPLAEHAGQHAHSWQLGWGCAPG